MYYFGVKKRLWIGFDKIYQGTNQILGFSATRGDENFVAPVDMAEYFVL
jgi:hypothetical protein